MLPTFRFVPGWFGYCAKPLAGSAFNPLPLGDSLRIYSLHLECVLRSRWRGCLRGLSARHQLEVRRELDQNAPELIEGLAISLELRLAGRNQVVKRGLAAHHGLQV